MTPIWMFHLDEDLTPIPNCDILSMSHISMGSKNMRSVLDCVGHCRSACLGLYEQGRRVGANTSLADVHRDLGCS